MAYMIRYSPHLGTNIGFIVLPIDPNHEITNLLWDHKALHASSGLRPWSMVNSKLRDILSWLALGIVHGLWVFLTLVIFSNRLSFNAPINTIIIIYVHYYNCIFLHKLQRIRFILNWKTQSHLLPDTELVFGKLGRKNDHPVSEQWRFTTRLTSRKCILRLEKHFSLLKHTQNDFWLAAWRSELLWTSDSADFTGCFWWFL